MKQMSFDPSEFSPQKNTPIPLYYQIEQFFLSCLETGRLQPNDCIPPELELAEAFGVSRATIRQSISNLVNRGILSRHKGKGTFVNPPKVEGSSLQALESFQEEMSKKGYLHETRVLSFSVTDAIPEVNSQLQLSEEEKLFCLERLRSINGEPVLVFKTYLPCRLFPDLLHVDFEQTSLYRCLEEKYGKRVDRVVRHIESSVSTRSESDILGIERNAPVFRVTFTSYAGYIPVEFSRTVYRGDRVGFVVELRR